MTMGIGKQFKYIREKREFTIEATAQGIITTNALTQFEADEKDIPLQKLQKLLLRMGVSLRQFANISDRLSQTSRQVRDDIHALYVAGNAPKLKEWFDNHPEVAPGDEQLAFFDHMLIAGKYFELTGERLCTEDEVEQLTNILLENLTWDESELDVLFWTLRLMNDNRVFMLSREVLHVVDGFRDWNFALYGAAWRTIIAGVTALVERHSNFAVTLVRQIDANEPMSEVMIANRFTYMFLKAVMLVQKNNVPENVQLVQDTFDNVRPLRSAELERNLRVIDQRTVNVLA
ncbi:hypothetical protein [Lacticaseibacillus sharpeae]|uniref:HTH cro/C1-type domain-containing protein n=2 Tax=Lacticaseibacillus sharpeae TaxID=1626 RepID=A0A0R1ZKS8_9LACO|nr:hypothetical protein [Lacticaseibacillus sharpeae]KRM54986.1 hypothetical protein FC18_GL001693 [Lacticaseibacillus sharpeae JCM 1186 = DSM 20505]